MIRSFNKALDFISITLELLINNVFTGKYLLFKYTVCISLKKGMKMESQLINLIIYIHLIVRTVRRLPNCN